MMARRRIVIFVAGLPPPANLTFGQFCGEAIELVALATCESNDKKLNFSLLVSFYGTVSVVEWKHIDRRTRWCA